MPWIIGSIVLTAMGYFADKTGEGVKDVSNSFVKVALVGGGLYLIGKKTKVI